MEDGEGDLLAERKRVAVLRGVDEQHVLVGGADRYRALGPQVAHLAPDLDGRARVENEILEGVIDAFAGEHGPPAGDVRAADDVREREDQLVVRADVGGRAGELALPPGRPHGRGAVHPQRHRSLPPRERRPLGGRLPGEARTLVRGRVEDNVFRRGDLVAKLVTCEHGHDARAGRRRVLEIKFEAVGRVDHAQRLVHHDDVGVGRRVGGGVESRAVPDHILHFASPASPHDGRCGEASVPPLHSGEPHWATTQPGAWGNLLVTGLLVATGTMPACVMIPRSARRVHAQRGHTNGFVANDVSP